MKTKRCLTEKSPLANHHKKISSFNIDAVSAGYEQGSGTHKAIFLSMKINGIFICIIFVSFYLKEYDLHVFLMEVS